MELTKLQKRFLREELKKFSPKYEGYYNLKCCLEYLVLDFRKYCKNMQKNLLSQVSEDMNVAIPTIIFNITYLLKVNESEYKGLTFKEALTGMALNILAKVQRVEEGLEDE